MNEYTFTVEYNGIAADETYVLTADGESTTLYILDEDGDREHVETTGTAATSLQAVAGEIAAAKQGFRDSDLYDAIQATA